MKIRWRCGGSAFVKPFSADLTYLVWMVPRRTSWPHNYGTGTIKPMPKNGTHDYTKAMSYLQEATTMPKTVYTSPQDQGVSRRCRWVHFRFVRAEILFLLCWAQNSSRCWRWPSLTMRSTVAWFDGSLILANKLMASIYRWTGSRIVASTRGSHQEGCISPFTSSGIPLATSVSTVIQYRESFNTTLHCDDFLRISICMNCNVYTFGYQFISPRSLLSPNKWFPSFMLRSNEFIKFKYYRLNCFKFTSLRSAIWTPSS